ncbi:type 4a pilus biogenesis protein PilO [Cellulomonas sp. Sa3CUA2]|uniref:Type 4a pilus biogenesis protein PilO n=1 Tax=Cellulomonas avistercoris TaxID=2762242 RepID=A0ABR8Q8T8_9CELL|nr:type 4a pilus biogenesis protein PilO [Cellulomonas avistercoris]MBD7916843.1 type 4a pilus biogenesis protein PilO [Cellulomonas avistercoris]
MKEAKSGPWIAGTVVVSLLLGAAGWLLMISPAFAAASETRVEAEAQVAQNDLTRIRINELKTQFEQIDALKAELNGLQAQIPTDGQLAEYRRQIAVTAAAHSVTVVALQTSTPTPVLPPVVEAPVEAPAEGEAAPTDDAAAAPAAPDPAVAQQALYAIPVTIDIVGTYQNVLAFLADVQSNQPRLLAVETITATSQQAAEASGGKPATAPGDLGLVVAGYLFALPDAAPVTPEVPADGEAPAPAPLPVPDPAKNPMVPLG